MASAGPGILELTLRDSDPDSDACASERREDEAPANLGESVATEGDAKDEVEDTPDAENLETG